MFLLINSFIDKWKIKYRWSDSNRHEGHPSTDFESVVSANFTTPAFLLCIFYIKDCFKIKVKILSLLSLYNAIFFFKNGNEFIEYR